MDENTIKQSLANLSPGVFSIVQQHSHMVRESAEFERLATKVWYSHHLDCAYTVEEVMQACREVCSHYPVPGLRTMHLLAYGDDRELTRRFIEELARVSQTKG